MINSDQKRNRSSNGDKWDLATPSSYPGILFLKWPTFDLEHGFTKSVVSIMICKVLWICLKFNTFFSNWILKVENSSFYSSLMKNNERPLFWKLYDFSTFHVFLWNQFWTILSKNLPFSKFKTIQHLISRNFASQKTGNFHFPHRVRLHARLIYFGQRMVQCWKLLPKIDVLKIKGLFQKGLIVDDKSFNFLLLKLKRANYSYGF